VAVNGGFEVKRFKLERADRLGQRWRVELAFLSLKHCFGDYIYAAKWINIVNELILKANIYNLFMNLKH